MAYVIGDDCIACGTCIDECPSGAISEGEKYSINPDVCTECGTCADVCPNEAIPQRETLFQKLHFVSHSSPSALVSFIRLLVSFDHSL